MVNKAYPANTPEMKKFCQVANSRIFTAKNIKRLLVDRSTVPRSLPKFRMHPFEPPTTPFCEFEVIGLFCSSILQVTISRVSISVCKERPKKKSG